MFQEIDTPEVNGNLENFRKERKDKEEPSENFTLEKCNNHNKIFTGWTH